jgi:DNA-binding response OmpR family regulator
MFYARRGWYMPETRTSREPPGILVVEAEPIVVKFIATILRLEGYRVLVARDGVEASGLFHEHAAKLALMIVAMITPRLTGAEFIASLPTLEPRIPVVFMTSLGDYEVQHTLQDKSRFFVLMKPFRAAALRATIRAQALPIAGPPRSTANE